MSQIPEPPKDRFCDLVMKGGITSGVVYPKAIALLSRHYRFKSIGGTSAGAIAAVVTAAAEYQRRQTGSRAGFDLLEELPTQLQAKVTKDKSKLLSLFQPQPATRRLFSVLTSALNSSGTYTRIFNILRGILLGYWPATLASLAGASMVATFGFGWFSATVVLVVALLCTIGGWVYFDITRALVANGFGICTGMTEDAENAALTPWLHELIQKAAGLALGDDPLTFGQLWGADGFPPAWLPVPDKSKVRSIDLQMFSTNLAHGRPYIFPLPEAAPLASLVHSNELLYFTRQEMEQCLPAEVVAWMIAKSKPYVVTQGINAITAQQPDVRQEMRELPEPKDFPVLLAARMSLSFPFLLTAIPLHAIDDDIPHKPSYRRCWFSDGGISSNFPMHLFDGLVPMWPTFGINLEPTSDGLPQVSLPDKYTDGYGERWNRFAEEKESKPASQLGGFIIAIVSAMQNWNDNSLARMPGVRDRVARVRLNQKEGGMNLNMEADLIEAIAIRGASAAHLLVKRFAVLSGNGDQAPGWDEHRFVRLNILLKMIEARIPGVARALNPDCQHVTNFATLLQKYLTDKDAAGDPIPPPGYENSMTEQQKQALDALVVALECLATEIAKQSADMLFKPIPSPELRVRPPL